MKKSELRRELERLAFDQADSGRGKLAKALRLLERLDRAGDIDYPVDDDGRFHPEVRRGLALRLTCRRFPRWRGR
jgi:hypothetical protein